MEGKIAKKTGFTVDLTHPESDDELIAKKYRNKPKETKYLHEFDLDGDENFIQTGKKFQVDFNIVNTRGFTSIDTDKHLLWNPNKARELGVTKKNFKANFKKILENAREIKNENELKKKNENKIEFI